MRHQPTVRHRIIAATAALALIAAACGGSAAEQDEGASSPTTAASSSPTRSGPPVPTAGFTTFDGEPTSLGAFAGKPVVLNFWASWCPSCVAEMSAAFRPVEETLGEEILFVGMNIQDDRAMALSLLEETGVQWLNAEDPNGELYRELGGLGMPFTVYISADGRVVDKHNGPLTEAMLREQIQENLLG